jgi:hypothetical protein
MSSSSKSTRYSVEQVEVDRARDDVMRVWRDNLADVRACERKFAWTYEQAPAAPLRPVLLVARRGERRDVVGSAGIARREFSVGGAPAWAGLMADLAVDRDHRTLGPALSLVRRCRQVAREQLAFVYGFPNAKAEPVFLRVGYRRLGPMTRYVRVLRHDHFAPRLVSVRLAARALGLVADAAVGARRWPARAASLARYRLVLTDAVDERADEVWAHASPHYGILAVRSPGYLSWRLAEHPDDRFRFAWLEERRTGAARAYAAITPVRGALAVGDFLGPPDAIGPLFEQLAGWARRQGAHSLTLRFLGDPRVSLALRRAGFQARDSSRAVVVETFEDRCARAGDAASWYLTDADEDI